MDAVRKAEVYQGAPCKRGHAGMRYASSGNCVECSLTRERPKVQERIRRPLELIAITGQGDAEGVEVAATIAAGGRMRREVFRADETPVGLIGALEEVVAWLKQDYLPC